jgi:uncharacterized protein
MLSLELLGERLAVCRLMAGEAIPESLGRSSFFCVTKTKDELSIVCEEAYAPTAAKVNGGWRALRVAGTLDFSLTGILASLAAPLAGAKVSIFAISTFDTDYLLVKDAELRRATEALRAAGFKIS